MTGAAISIENAAAANTILSIKKRLYAANPKLRVCRQRLVYSAGPHGMDPLADNETLRGAGVAQDGSAKLDVLLADLTEEEADEFGPEVCFSLGLCECNGQIMVCRDYTHFDVVFNVY
jgi:hypothetical protein